MVDQAAKILVVDDEVRMCDSLYALLTSIGHEVETAFDGDSACEKIATTYYDVVLSDIKLPGKDGIDVLRAAKDKDPHSVVILMTAYASLESAMRAVSEGAYDYLLKPVEFSHLKLAVDRAIDKRRSDRAREQLVNELQQKNHLLKRRIAEINALYRAGKSLSTTVELPELLAQIINLATTVIGAATGSIMLLDRDSNELRIQAGLGVDRQVMNNTVLPLGSSIAGYVAQSGKPVMVEDIEKDQRFKRTAKDHYQSKSFLCVPLRIKNEILGVINLTDKKGDEVFGRQDMKLLTTFASQAAMAIDDANHYEDARRKLKQFAVLYEIASMIPAIERFDRMSS
ncbi:MAG: GAF domain-containing protein, partial [candidate division Zixibacteria bacterium]|nr:GAF domain-containing protein [candidate division Zixibacteria bacterium]